MLTRKEIAKALRVNLRTVIRFEKEGQLTPLRTKGAGSKAPIYYKESEVEKIRLSRKKVVVTRKVRSKTPIVGEPIVKERYLNKSVFRRQLIKLCLANVYWNGYQFVEGLNKAKLFFDLTGAKNEADQRIPAQKYDVVILPVKVTVEIGS